MVQAVSIRNQVMAFHVAADVPVLQRPTIPSDIRVALRAKLIAEEFFELLEAMYAPSGYGEVLFNGMRDDVREWIERTIPEVDLVALADACADLDYVVEGTRLEFGIAGGPVADEVHAANMRKFGPGAHKRRDGKVLKPEGWQPPDIARVLREQGMKP